MGRKPSQSQLSTRSAASRQRGNLRDERSGVAGAARGPGEAIGAAMNRSEGRPVAPREKRRAQSPRGRRARPGMGADDESWIKIRSGRASLSSSAISFTRRRHLPARPNHSSDGEFSVNMTIDLSNLARCRESGQSRTFGCSSGRQSSSRRHDPHIRNAQCRLLSWEIRHFSCCRQAAHFPVSIDSCVQGRMP
jgi:hypothetical protein